MKTIIISVCAVISLACVSCVFYKIGKKDQKAEDARSYGYMFDVRSLEQHTHFRAMGIEPDSVFYCHECKKIFLDYGHTNHEHRYEELRRTFRPLD